MENNQTPKRNGKREKINYSKIEEMNRQKITQNMKTTPKETQPKKRTNPTIKSDSKVQEELPRAIKRNITIENQEDVSLERTNDILKQINQYLDKEKKNLEGAQK